MTALFDDVFCGLCDVQVDPDDEDSTTRRCDLCDEETSCWNYNDDRQVVCTECEEKSDDDNESAAKIESPDGLTVSIPTDAPVLPCPEPPVLGSWND